MNEILHQQDTGRPQIGRGRIEPEEFMNAPKPEPFPSAGRSGSGRRRTGLDFFDPGQGGAEPPFAPTDEESFNPEDYTRRLFNLWTAPLPEHTWTTVTRRAFIEHPIEEARLPVIPADVGRSKEQRIELANLLRPIRSTDCAKEYLTFLHDYCLASGLFIPDRLLPVRVLGVHPDSRYDLNPYHQPKNSQRWEYGLVRNLSIKIDDYDKGVITIPEASVLAEFYARWNRQLLETYP